MSLKRNIPASYATQIDHMLVGVLILDFPYFKYMGAEAYGLAGFFALLQARFKLLDRGVTPTVARETARLPGGATGALSRQRLWRAPQRIFFAGALRVGSAMFGLSGVIAAQWLMLKPLSMVPVRWVLQLLADVTAHALRHLQARPQDGGLYHCVAAGEINWNLYSKEVLAQAVLAQPAIKLKVTEVAPVRLLKRQVY